MTDVPPKIRKGQLAGAGYAATDTGTPPSAQTLGGGADTGPQLAPEFTGNPLGGIPADYAASQATLPPGDPRLDPALAALTRRGPLYFTGDEWLPASYPIERRIVLQNDLIAAGVLSPPFQKGEWDTRSREAYSQLLARANASGQSFDQALADAKSNIARFGSAGASRNIAPGVIELTNPQQIGNLADEMAVRVMGRRLDPAARDRFAATYNQMEREYQRQQYQLQVDGAANTIAGEVVQPQSLADYGTDIAAQVKADNPQDAAVVSTLNAADIFFQMLRSSRSTG